MERLDESADIDRLEAAVCDEFGHAGLGLRVISAEEHRGTHVVVRIHRVVEILEAVDAERLHDPGVRDEFLDKGGPGTCARQAVREPGTDGVRAVHEDLARERIRKRTQHRFVRGERNREKHDLRALHRLGERSGGQSR